MPLMDKSLEAVLQDERQREACTPAQRVRYACDIFTGIAYLRLQFFGHPWALSRYCGTRNATLLSVVSEAIVVLDLREHGFVYYFQSSLYVHV